MTIWILAFLLFGLFAWFGLLEGAVRATILLIGLILGAFLAGPLGHLLQPVFPLIGVTNPFWNWLLPAVLAFLLIQIVFAVIAFLVHRKVELFYKYRSDDVQRLRWERLNKRLGACVGALTGAGYLILLGALIYAGGYASLQVASADTSPKPMQLLNQARQDLRSSGLESLVARFDPATPLYYQATDIIGLIYNNPLLQGRLASYPALLSMGQRPEFQDIATDTEFNQMLQSQEDVMKVINHPKVQTILKNKEIMSELAQLDLRDLDQFLRTGKSPKFEEENLLGRWQLDAGSTFIRLKSVLTNVPASAVSSLRQGLKLSQMELIATPENKVYVLVQAQEEIKQLATAPPPTAAASAAAGARSPRPPGPGISAGSIASRANPETDPRMLQRYGNLLNQQQQQAAPVIAAPPKPAAPSPVLKLLLAGEGTWKREGDTYTITVQQEGKSVSLHGIIRDDALTLTEPGFVLAFDKAY
jgi:hypothetical protein